MTNETGMKVEFAAWDFNSNRVELDQIQRMVSLELDLGGMNETEKRIWIQALVLYSVWNPDASVHVGLERSMPGSAYHEQICCGDSLELFHQAMERYTKATDGKVFLISFSDDGDGNPHGAPVRSEWGAAFAVAAFIVGSQDEIPNYKFDILSPRSNGVAGISDEYVEVRVNMIPFGIEFV